MITITVRVIPKSGRHQWSIDALGRLKCHLKSQPEDGAANTELLRSLAKAADLLLHEVKIISGATGRTKLISLATSLTYEALLARLGIGGSRALL